MSSIVDGMTRCLLVPGRGIPLPQHWMSRWADADPDFRWAPEPPGPPYVAHERVAALHAAVTAGDEPAVLVAHSAGRLTAVFWAARHTGPVRAALLVTPPLVEVFGPIPRTPLPFRTIVVASRNDPYTTFEQFEDLARDWGADLHDAGAVGHLNSAAGFGPWPDGERLVRTLAGPGQSSTP
jgi:predicted alpha/beta hydrolase family esterase